MILTTLDLVVIFIYLALVIGVGGWFFKGLKSREDYLLAGRSMSWIPVGLSVTATAYSAISYLGYPAEVYSYGLEVYIVFLASLVAAPVVMYVFMPFFHKLRVVTAYEYLECRFNGSVRTTASILFIIWRLMWLSTAIYVPSLVMSLISGLPLIPVIVIVGASVVFYTVLGGMKAVIWTDVIQCFIMVGGMALAFVYVLLEVGSFSKIWEIGAAAGKTRIFNMSIDPTIRVTFWGALIGMFFSELAMAGSDQVVVQRYLTAKSLKDMQRSYLIYAIVSLPIGAFLCVIGLGLYAFYKTNPHLLPEGISGDKIFPFFIVKELPAGVSGLIIASLFAAAMSTISSGVNSLATSISVDMYDRLSLFKRKWTASGCDSNRDTYQLRFDRAVTLIVGIVITVMACFVGRLGTIIEIANKLINGFSGPLLGIFLLGMLTRRAGSGSVMVAAIISTLIAAYINFFSPLSFFWFSAIGCLNTIAMGYVFSLFWRSPDEEKTRGLVLDLFKAEAPEA